MYKPLYIIIYKSNLTVCMRARVCVCVDVYVYIK